MVTLGDGQREKPLAFPPRQLKQGPCDSPLNLTTFHGNTGAEKQTSIKQIYSPYFLLQVIQMFADIEMTLTIGKIFI